MFSICKNLSSIDLSLFNTKNVTSMTYMFYRCEKLKSLDLSFFETEKITNKEYMFLQCKDLRKIILKKNFFKNIENIYDKNKDFIKQGYCLINSIEYKYNDLKIESKRLGKRIICELNFCNFAMGFQILTFMNNTLFGVLEGPISSPYQKGFFLFKIIFSFENPFKTPKFYFISKIFHPNVGEDGFVSVDIFHNMWTISLTTSSIILSIQSLLDTPDTNFFLNQKAAKLYNQNKNRYNEVVEKYTSKYANYSIFKKELDKLGIKDKFIYI